MQAQRKGKGRASDGKLQNAAQRLGAGAQLERAGRLQANFLDLKMRLRYLAPLA